jgi:hypothetical protein
MPIHDSVDQTTAIRVVQDASVALALSLDLGVTGLIAFRRAWIRDLGRLARTHHDDWVISSYAVQIIRQLRGQLPIT